MLIFKALNDIFDTISAQLSLKIFHWFAELTISNPC